MGPPLFSGGNTQRRLRTSAAQRGFNGAAAVQRRKWPSAKTPRRRKRLLQWGRRCSAAEICRRPCRALCCKEGFNGAAAVQRRKSEVFDHLPAGHAASMGPPLFSGGNSRRRVLHIACEAASMGPPLFSGGNALDAARISAALPVLQWGRRCSAAEMMISGVGGQNANVLQWGRRCSAAEMREEINSGMGQAIWLQWGRRCSAAEMLVSAIKQAPGMKASMGPPLFSGGNQFSARILASSAGFNGAAAVQRRK